ncbi:MAG TPA: hypothetical protein VM324_02905 [Egibacteraceae bacterium]|jgi:hypothetical protein|nr:hypothetical protein [Egibacteraceae bacterium]
MTAVTVQAPPPETSLRPVGGGIGDFFAIAAEIAELADTPDARRAVAAITATITERTGHRDLAPDRRDVPLAVRQREFAVAARRLDLPAGPRA